jgi:hypothetical protein
MTTFGDQLYQYGGTPVGGLFTTGKVWFVKPSTGSDGNTGKRPDRAVKTLAKAITLASADKNDVIYMVSESNTAASTTDYQSANLAFSKDLVHVAGIGAPSPYSNRARIAQLSTATGVTNLVTISGDGGIYKNFSIFHGVADATSLRAMQVTGTRNVFENLHIAGIGDTTMLADGACSLLLDGCSENKFVDCTIGLDTIGRDGTAGTAELILDGGASKTHFVNCLFQAFITNAGYEHVLVEDNTGAGGITLFKNCLFHSWSANVATPQDQIFSIPSPGGGLNSAQFVLMDSYYSTDDASCVWATTGVSLIRNNAVAAAAAGAGGEMTIL